jgi:hypothetical protein
VSGGPRLFRGTVEALMASGFLLVVILVLDPPTVIVLGLAVVLSALVIIRNAR